jgi:hypothetical protein
MQGNVIRGGFLLSPEFNRQSSGLCVLRIVFQPPQVRSKASSCISSSAKFSGGRPAILALLLPFGTLTITLSSITAQLQQPYEVPSIFQSNWLTICHVQTTTMAGILSRRLKLESRLPAPAKSAAIAAIWKASAQCEVQSCTGRGRSTLCRSLYSDR